MDFNWQQLLKNDIEIMENTEGMTNQEGVQFLERVMKISDVIILGCNTSFSELEQEKNLPNGAIIRQVLRLSNQTIDIIIAVTSNNPCP